eukprot:SAG31_NODE_3225_length_4519_cov_2.363122_4_plen_189_part_00
MVLERKKSATMHRPTAPAPAPAASRRAILMLAAAAAFSVRGTCAQEAGQASAAGIFPAPEQWLNGTCDVLTLHEQVAQVDAHCASGECSVECIADLLPLVASCRTFLYRLLDRLDGTLDGVYAPLADLLTTCQEMPPASLLADLKLLNSQGRCPEEMLDGVGTTEVKAPTCSDAWGGALRNCDRDGLI